MSKLVRSPFLRTIRCLYCHSNGQYSGDRCVKIPGAVVSSPAVQIVGSAVFDSQGLQDNQRPFPGAAVLLLARRLLLDPLHLLPPRQRGRSDGRSSSFTHAVCLVPYWLHECLGLIMPR